MSHQKTEVVSKSNKLTFLRTADLECCIWWVEYHSWLSYFAIIFVNAHFQCYYTAIFLFSYSIVSRPVTLACGHSGYKNCMETWAESTATPLCPQCRATFRKEELRINVAMDKGTQDLPVKCNSQTCQWKGNYSDANDHLKHCPKVREVPQRRTPAHGSMGRNDSKCLPKRKDPMFRMPTECNQGKTTIPPYIFMHHYHGMLYWLG